MSRIEITRVEVERIFQGLPATALHVPGQTPLRRRIVEARPGRPNRDLVGMVVAHVLVEIVQVLLAPVTSVSSPPPLSGLTPSVESGEISAVFYGRRVFIEEQRGRFPPPAAFHNAIPVDVPLFRKYENYRMPLVVQVSTAMRSLRSNVILVGFVHRGQRLIRGLGILVFRLVIEKNHLEMALVGRLLEQPKIV